MLYSDLYGLLIFQTKRNDITHTEIGEIIGLERRAAAARAKRNGKVKPDEVEKIEKYYNVDLNSIVILDNSGSRQNDTSLEEKIKSFGKRVSELQAQHNFLDREMATLLKISEKDYLKLVTGKNLPNLDILMNIKRNFNVSIDYLLWG